MLTFCFIIIHGLFSKHQLSNSTKLITPATETTTSTAPSKCRLNPLMAYLRVAPLLFFCSFHSFLTFIFIIFQRLLYSFQFFLYYNTSVMCIYRALHNITTKQQQQQRRGQVQSLLFCLLNYIIIFSIIFLYPTTLYYDCMYIHPNLIHLFAFEKAIFK